ncbi:MAG: RHS repeat-associated core domain-containing protein [Pseudolysinimonas sp.]
MEFTGNWADPDAGLIYLRARDYDPATGQLLSVDPAVDQTRQPYAYVSNSPLDRADPTGLCFLGGNDPFACMYWHNVLGPVPVVGAALSVADCVNSGTGNGYECTVMTLDPVYSVLEGYSNEIRDTQNGCPAWQIALDGAEGVVGLVGTVGIAGGFGEGAESSGIVSAIRSLDWASDAGELNLSRNARRTIQNLNLGAEMTVAEAIRIRGGGASQVNGLQTGYGQKTLAEIAILAANKDPQAVKALK